jgi:hypothetical protein
LFPDVASLIRATVKVRPESAHLWVTTALIADILAETVTGETP